MLKKVLNSSGGGGSLASPRSRLQTRRAPGMVRGAASDSHHGESSAGFEPLVLTAELGKKEKRHWFVHLLHAQLVEFKVE